jgi:predicted AAA+ superfamily ATPase
MDYKKFQYSLVESRGSSRKFAGSLLWLYDAGIIDGNLGIYKGAVYKNIVADMFAKSGKKLYYFEYNSQLEIDFFIRYLGIATAVEVESADT